MLRSLFCSIALVLTLALWSPGVVRADPEQSQTESTETADAEQANKAQSQNTDKSKEEKNKTITAGNTSQQTAITVIEVEVNANKYQDLTIGQQKNAEGVNNYVVTQSSTGSKSDVANKDLPQSITVVGQKIMKDQNNLTASEALSNVAGVRTQQYPSYADTLLAFYIRGFDAGSYVYTDGLWDPCTTYSGWIGNVDRIEVLKGPASVLYGNGTAGGLINYVTKKPLPYWAFAYGAEYGSRGTKSVDADMSIPLTEDKKWLSRTIIQNTDYASFQRGADPYKRFNGSFIVQGQPVKNTTYTFETQFNDYYGPSSSLLPLKGTINPPYGLVPYDANYYDPRYKSHTIGRAFSTRVDHKINDIWTVHSGLRYSFYAYQSETRGGSTLVLNSANPSLSTVSQSYGSMLRFNNAIAWDTTANAKFQTGELGHDLTTGITWAHFNQYIPYFLRGSSAAVNVLDPVFAGEPTLSKFGMGMGGRHSESERYGAYLSDVVALSPKFKVNLGESLTMQSSSIDGSYRRHNSGSARRIGTTYETSPGVTWFAGTETYYEPQVPRNDGYQYIYFPPETGDQVEGGVKVDVSDRASVTLSVYRINRENIVYGVQDPYDVLHTIYSLVGKQRSKGFDLDASYVIRPGWNVSLAYSHCDARVLSSDSYASNSVVPNVPLNSVKLWSTYEYQDGPRKGWGFGGGLTFAGKRTVDTNNSLGWMDGYTVFDAVVYYKTKDWRYSLNVYNLTNEKYWESGSSSGVYAGTPRSFVLRIERSFF